MATTYVNGSGAPRFICTLLGSRTSVTIDLPLTNEGGLTEKWEEVTIQHKILINGFQERIIQKILGWRATFTLDYTQFVQKDTMFKMKNILDSAQSGHNIQIIPRIDDLSRRFDVYYSGQSFDLNILRGGTNSIGNKSVQLEFTTIDLQSAISFSDPDLVPLMYFTHNTRMLVL